MKLKYSGNVEGVNLSGLIDLRTGNKIIKGDFIGLLDVNQATVTENNYIIYEGGIKKREI